MMKKNILLGVLIISSVFLVSCQGAGQDSSSSVPGAPRQPASLAPTLVISSASRSKAAHGQSVDYDITYTNAALTTLSAADILISASGSASCSKAVSNLSRSGAKVSFSNCLGDGSVSFSIAAGTAVSGNGVSAGASGGSASFTVDNTGISSISPSLPTGYYSNMPSSMQYSFPEDMDMASITAADFSFGGSCSGVGLASLVKSATQVTLNLSGTGGCVLGQTLSITSHLAGMADASGNLGSGSDTQIWTMLNVGPTSGAYAPAAGRVGPGLVSVSFTPNSSLDPASVSASDFSLSGSCTGVGISGVMENSGVITVSLSGVSSCANGQNFILTADLAGFDDLSGYAGIGSSAVTYTYDNVAPLASFNASSSLVPGIPSDIDVTFSSDTDMPSLQLSNFQLGGTCTGASFAGLNYAGAIATLSLTGHCNDGETLIVGLDLAGVSDLAGNIASGTSSVTYTLDSVGPAAVIAQAAGDVSFFSSSVNVSFSSDTDMNTVTAARFTVGGDCGATLASISKSANVATVQFSGQGSCGQGQSMSLSVDMSQIADVLGNLGSGTQDAAWTLDSQGPDGIFSLASGSLAAIPSSLTLTLAADTNMSSVTSGDFSVSGSCGASLSSIAKSGQVVTLNLSGTGSCADGQSVVISANQAGFTDNLGNAGSGSVSVALTADLLAPVVSLNFPTGFYNPLPSLVTATFSADTDMSTVSMGNFIILGSCPVSLDSLSISGQVATLHLGGTSSCLNGTTTIITANPLGVQDMAGNIGLNLPVTVTHTYDNVAPGILLTLPLGTPVASMPSSLTVTLDLDTDMSTVTAADFAVGGTCGATLGSISKTANAVTVNLNGTGACASGKTVSVSTILSGIRDQAGNAGVGTSTQTFTKL